MTDKSYYCILYVAARTADCVKHCTIFHPLDISIYAKVLCIFVIWCRAMALCLHGVFFRGIVSSVFQFSILANVYFLSRLLISMSEMALILEIWTYGCSTTRGRLERWSIFCGDCKAIRYRCFLDKPCHHYSCDYLD